MQEKNLETISTDQSSREQEASGRSKAALGAGATVAVALTTGLLGFGCVNQDTEGIPQIVRHNGEVIHTTDAFDTKISHYDLGDQAYKLADSISKGGRVTANDFRTMLYLLKQADYLKISVNEDVKTLGATICQAFESIARKYQDGETYEIVVGITHIPVFDNEKESLAQDYSRRTSEFVLSGATYEEVKNAIDEIADRLSGDIRERAGLPRKFTPQDNKKYFNERADLSLAQMNGIVDSTVVLGDADAIRSLMDAKTGTVYVVPSLLFELGRQFKSEHIVRLLDSRDFASGNGGDYLAIKSSSSTMPLGPGEDSAIRAALVTLAEYKQ